MAYNQNTSQGSGERVRYDLKEHIGVLSTRDNGWIREVNIVAWNGREAKVDIREWAPDHKRMTKGVTLFEDEAETLARMLAIRYGMRVSETEPARRPPVTEDSKPWEQAGGAEAEEAAREAVPFVAEEPSQMTEAASPGLA